jgi:hypothetical protein
VAPQVSCGGEVVLDHQSQLPVLVNRSVLPLMEVQLLDEHGLATGPQGPDKLKLQVFRHSSSGEEELHELQQLLSVPLGGLVRGACAGRGWALL